MGAWGGGGEGHRGAGWAWDPGAHPKCSRAGQAGKGLPAEAREKTPQQKGGCCEARVVEKCRRWGRAAAGCGAGRGRAGRGWADAVLPAAVAGLVAGKMGQRGSREADTAKWKRGGGAAAENQAAALGDGLQVGGVVVVPATSLPGLLGQVRGKPREAGAQRVGRWSTGEGTPSAAVLLTNLNNSAGRLRRQRAGSFVRGAAWAVSGAAGCVVRVSCVAPRGACRAAVLERAWVPRGGCSPQSVSERLGCGFLRGPPARRGERERRAAGVERARVTRRPAFGRAAGQAQRTGLTSGCRVSPPLRHNVPRATTARTGSSAHPRGEGSAGACARSALRRLRRRWWLPRDQDRAACCTDLGGEGRAAHRMWGMARGLEVLRACVLPQSVCGTQRAPGVRRAGVCLLGAAPTRVLRCGTYREQTRQQQAGCCRAPRRRWSCREPRAAARRRRQRHRRRQPAAAAGLMPLLWRQSSAASAAGLASPGAAAGPSTREGRRAAKRPAAARTRAGRRPVGAAARPAQGPASWPTGPAAARRTQASQAAAV